MPDVKGGLVVEPRPMVSVTLNEYHEIIISVTGMDAELEHIKMDEVCFPADCLDSVIQALQDLKK